MRQAGLNEGQQSMSFRKGEPRGLLSKGLSISMVTNSSSEANPLLLCVSKMQRMRRGKQYHWMLRNQKQHPQSSLLPIRAYEGKGERKLLIGFALPSDWRQHFQRLQSCAKTSSPLIHAQIRASQKPRVTGFHSLITSKRFQLQRSNFGCRRFTSRPFRLHAPQIVS